MPPLGSSLITLTFLIYGGLQGDQRPPDKGFLASLEAAHNVSL